MDYRQLGRSGLKVPVLSLGTGTFGGGNEFFQRWGQTDVRQAKRMIDLCLDAGVSFFDTADVYSEGKSEEILGQALKGRRDKVLISTKA
jgi:aryl-alcohol dehydrogenase-like predicted oxidoreductase